MSDNGFTNLNIIENCYSTGIVKGTSHSGGAVGYDGFFSRAQANNVFWNTRTSLLDKCPFGEGKRTYQMTQSKTFQQWDFDSIWRIEENVSYPYLRWQGSNAEGFNIPIMPAPNNLRFSSGNQGIKLFWSSPPDDFYKVEGYNVYRDELKINSGPLETQEYLDSNLIDWENYSYTVTAVYRQKETPHSVAVSAKKVVFAGGKGSEEFPYLIETAEQLDAIRYSPYAYFRQIADINLGESPWNDDEGWLPLFSATEVVFRGHYDGNMKVIDNIYIDRPESDYQSLFGRSEKANISNLGMTNVKIVGLYGVAGLLGESKNTIIENCYVEGYVEGASGVGLLVGYCREGSHLNHCYSSGSIVGKVEIIDFIFSINTSSNIGGLTGLSSSSRISYSYSFANVFGDNTVGGLVGQSIANSVIKCSFSSGNVNGENYVGGLTGAVTQSSIISSYSTSSVDGIKHVGGLIGVVADTDSIVLDSYHSGLVEGNSFVGGLIGFRDYSGSERVVFVNNCFWNSELSGQLLSNGGIGLTNSGFMQPETFEDWALTDHWLIKEGVGYPYLKWQRSIGSNNLPRPYGLRATSNVNNMEIILRWKAFNEPLRFNIYRDNRFIVTVNYPLKEWTDNQVNLDKTYAYSVTAVLEIDSKEIETSESSIVSIILSDKFAGGSGTKEEPWLIETAEQLSSINGFLGIKNRKKYFMQTGDINLGTEPWNHGEGWLPIGDSSDNSFYGSYDGQGYIVKNLYINRPDNNSQGLLGHTKRATIKNVAIRNAEITGNENVGSLIGKKVEGRVTNSSSTGLINGTGSNVGGLIGYLDLYTTIQGSSHTGSVTGDNRVGGIVGFSDFSNIIENCYASGIVKGVKEVGGIAGAIGNWMCPCCFYGNIQPTLVTYCHFSGRVIGTGDSVGGIAGASYRYTVIEKCHNMSNVTGNNSVGGLVGENSHSDINNSYSKGRVSGNEKVGGLVGKNIGPVVNSYSTGRVSGEKETGGLIGQNYSRVESSYWSTRLSSQKTSDGGNERKRREMRYPYSGNTFIEWDFETIWIKDVQGKINKGYPYLRSKE